MSLGLRPFAPWQIYRLDWSWGFNRVMFVFVVGNNQWRLNFIGDVASWLGFANASASSAP